MATWGTEVIGCRKTASVQKHVTQSKNVNETETKSSAQNNYKKLSTKQSM